MATVEAVTVLVVASILIQAATAAEAAAAAVVTVGVIVVVSPVIIKRNKSDCTVTNMLGIADTYSCILAYFQLIFLID